MSESSETAPEIFRLVEELSQVRGALGNVQTELLANKQRQDSILESIQSVTTKNKSTEGDSNAMFRLAASLDQLGARIEERLKHQGQSFESRLSDVTTSVVRAQQEVTEAVDQVKTTVSRVASEIEVVKQQEQYLANQISTLSQPAPPSQVAPVAANFSQETEDSPEFTQDDFGFVEEQTKPESSEEDLHVYVELEEEVALPPEPEPGDSTAAAGVSAWHSRLAG